MITETGISCPIDCCPEDQRDGPSRTKPSLFLEKSYAMLQEEANHGIVRWSDDGKSFKIIDQNKFVNEVLPRYFKHNKLRSFQRQLYIHNFRNKKNKSLEYMHPCFNRSFPSCLRRIGPVKGKRKITAVEKSQRLSKAIVDNQQLKKKLDSMQGCCPSLNKYPNEERAMLIALKIHRKVKKVEVGLAPVCCRSNDQDEKSISMKLQAVLDAVKALQSQKSTFASNRGESVAPNSISISQDPCKAPCCMEEEACSNYFTEPASNRSEKVPHLFSKDIEVQSEYNPSELMASDSGIPELRSMTSEFTITRK